MMAESEKTEVERSVRKLRKKLREIDRLEQRNETLAVEEEAKVAKKSVIRRELLRLLSRHSDISTSALCHPVKAEPLDSSIPDASWEGESSSLSEEPEDQSQKDRDDDPICGMESDDSCLATAEHGRLATAEHGHLATAEHGHLATAEHGRLATAEQRSVNSNAASPEAIIVDAAQRSESVKKTTKVSPNVVKKEKKNTVNAENLDRRRRSPADNWKNSRFLVRDLSGHDGLVTAVALRDDVLLTGSQDTTVKRWSVATCEEVRSMCGHTDSVTCVVLLTPTDSRALANQLRDSSDGGGDVAVATGDASSVSMTTDDVCLVGISGSHDCCIKIWNLETGCCMKSIYTFNPLTCLKLLREGDRFYIICGTGGGKLELWDLSSTMSSPIQSTIAHKDSVTAICVDGRDIYSTSADGVIKVFQFSSGPSLHLIHNSEDVQSTSGRHKKICCVAVSMETLYVGNEGANVKAINWRSGSVRRLANHTTEFGHTSCLLTDIKGLLISTGYDLDHGYGYVNVRSLPDEKYLCSLCDAETSLIVAMATGCSQDGGITMVTGGMRLKIWKQLTNEKDERKSKGWTLLTSLHVPRFDRPALDSDISDQETDSDNDFHDDPPAPWQRDNDRHGDENNGGWLSWCCLL